MNYATVLTWTICLPFVCVPLKADVLLFSDPFLLETAVTLEEASTERQSGEAAPLGYRMAPGETDAALADDQARLERGGLLVENGHATFVSLSPNLDFSQAARDAFRVRVEIEPETGSTKDSGDRWAQIHIGGEEPNRFVAASGIGILIRSDASREDGYQIFHNGQHVASGSVDASDQYQFNIVVEDGDLAFAINGKLQRPFDGGAATYQVGNLRLGYVTMAAHNPLSGEMVSRFSRLSITRLETGSGSALILSSLDAPGDTAFWDAELTVGAYLPPPQSGAQPRI